jgi:4-aminobutyrate aminotransferase-like enzyme/Ser/Thr protein kinase RdoA (MazF antagonist)
MDSFSPAEASRLARELYGLDASAEPLPSERDRNFRLRSPRGQYVLKIAGAAERPEALDLQARALAWLAERDSSLPVPRLVRTRDGAEVAEADGRFVRLVTYLPGTTLTTARPRSPELYASLGRFLGRLDTTLLSFRHPAAHGRDLLWDPACAPQVIARHVGAIADPERRALVAHFERQRVEILEPIQHRLPRSVIHNDANDANVLVGRPEADPHDREVTGLLDFGDMVETWTVCELAVAMAYAIFEQPDPLASAGPLVAGYHAVRTLADEEIAAVWTLAATRLCTSVCLSAHRRTAEPDNPYLLVSEPPAWEALARMREIHPRLAHYRLRAACGLEPCPQTPAIAKWLHEHGSEIGPVVSGDLSQAVVFDLSVGSPVFQSPAQATDTEAMTAKLFGALAAKKASTGIGRYDEARLIYATDAFEGPATEHPERRTVHLAFDLFEEAGSPVFAPLPGRVHSARDNAGRGDYGPTVILEHAPPDAPRFYTLYGHLTADSLLGLEPRMPVSKGQRIGSIGAPPGNGDWPPHVHFQIVADMLDRDSEFPGVAAASQRATWLSLCPDPNLIVRGPERFRAPGGDGERLRAERRTRLGPSLSVAYRRPLTIVRGFGTYLYDQSGRAFLDMVNNVAHVGHAHPRVVRAGARQMAVLNTNTRYLHPSILRYAERLAETLPEPLSVCFFVCSGSEANELALRMARAATGSRGVIVVDGAYHGNTQTLVNVSPYKFDGPGGSGAPPWVHKVPMPDDYRGLYRREDPERAAKFASHVAEAVRVLRDVGHPPAAFLCESLLSCGGQVELPPGYLAAAYGQARAAGAVCIADEVQVGFGRVGSEFWGFQTQEVVPDIVTMGKPIGNGHPLAAVVTTPAIARAFANGMEYFNTFGGNPVSCEIGLAVLDVIREERLQERALRAGGKLKRDLERLADRHPAVGDVRGRGLFLGIELVLDRTSREPAAAKAGYVVERMKDHGILLSTDGPDHNVIKMKPPLSFGEEEAERVAAAYDRVLAEDFVRSS